MTSLTEERYQICTALFVIAHVFGLAALVFLGLYINYDGLGFSTLDANLEFRYHPILMCLSLFFLNGEAIMLYRGLRTVKKQYTKAAHAILHCVSFVLLVLGLKAVFDSHDYSVDKEGRPAPKPNLRTGHSWFGIVTVSVYAAQLLGGLVTFYFPKTPTHTRRAVMPYHRAFGLAIFGLSLAALMMGAAEKAAWSLRCPHGDLCEENVFINLFTICCLLYAACVFTVVTIYDWVRQPLPGEVPGKPLTTTTYHQNAVNLATVRSYN